MAARPCSVLSIPESVSDVARSWSGGFTSGDYGACVTGRPIEAVSSPRLVLVFDHAGTCDWVDPGWRPGPRGSLHLSAFGWGFCNGSLGRQRFDQALAWTGGLPWFRRGCCPYSLLRARSRANRLLERQRAAFSACAGSD